MKLLERIKYLIRYSSEELYEFHLSIVTLWWGVFAFFPMRSAFGVTNHTILSIYANQKDFAVIASMLGAYYLISIFYDFLLTKKILNILISIFWTFVTILYLANNLTSTAVVLYGSLAIFSSLTFLRQ